MAGVWPGGGLFAIPALKIGDDVWVHTTFGFTNPDMPTGVALEKTGFDADEQGRRRVRTRIVKHEPAAKTDGAAGYGYSIMLATRSKDRPLNFLQWAVNAEIVNDVGRLGRVARHDGLTVDDLAVGPGTRGRRSHRQGRAAASYRRDAPHRQHDGTGGDGDHTR